MEALSGFDVGRLREMAGAGAERIERAKRMQAAYWRGEKTECPPIISGGGLLPEQKCIPSPNLKEAFYDSRLMLCGQMRGAIGAINSGSEAVPSIRANMGVGVLLSLFGGAQLVFEDKMPWPKDHFSKEMLSKFTVKDIRIRGDFELGMKHMRYFKEVMGDSIPVYCMDHQGPFDLAHLIFGDQLFMEIYDDPDFVRHLMDLCVEVSIKAIEMMKEAGGEGKSVCHHSNMIYADNMGIRICEDTTVLLGPDQIAEFAMPYTAKLAGHFGGAWVHYCGRNDHLTEQVCAIPEIRGINFGVIPGKEHEHEFEKDMERCLNSKTIYVGDWPRRPCETPKDYLKRLHFWAKQGCMIPSFTWPADEKHVGMGRKEMLDLWCSGNL